MWPLVILGAAAWYLTRPGRNPQLALWDQMPEPRRSAPEQPTARGGKAHTTEAETELAPEIVARAVQYRRDLERMRGEVLVNRVAQKNATRDEAAYRQALRAEHRADAKVDQLVAKRRDERTIAAARVAAQQASDETARAWRDWQFALRYLSSEQWKVTKETARLERERASIYALAGVDDGGAKSRIGRERLRQLRALMQPFQQDK